MKSLASFVGTRLRDARLARMMTAASLAEAVGVGSPAISKYERASVTPRQEILQRLSETLRVPVPYFFKDPIPSTGHLYMRSQASTTKRARESAEVRTGWLREISGFLANSFESTQIDVPKLICAADPASISDDDIEDAALALRSSWGMREGPIGNMTTLLESKGILVSRFSLNNEKLDAFSAWPAEGPVAIENSDRCTGVRMRFDLAHELAHLVIHRDVPESAATRSELHRLMEKQAHRFGAAFLFPATSFCNEVYSVRVDALLELKARWKVSVQMMTVRARDLQLISENQYIRAFKVLSAQGLRRSEPLDDVLEIEAPRLLSNKIHELVENGGYTKADVVGEMRLDPRDIEVLAGLPRGYFDEDFGVVRPIESGRKGNRRADNGKVIELGRLSRPTSQDDEPSADDV